jgi:hypothetical protein
MSAANVPRDVLEEVSSVENHSNVSFLRYGKPHKIIKGDHDIMLKFVDFTNTSVEWRRCNILQGSYDVKELLIYSRKFSFSGS